MKKINETACCFVDSPVGVLRLAEDGQGVCGVEFADEAGYVPPHGVEVASLNDGEAFPGRYLPELCRQLSEYFAGRRAAFDVPLSPSGTPFQLAVWDALTRIPYGETRCYRDIAREVGRPNGARAVGGANRANRLCIVVPCHRVIASDGGLGGYSAGLDRKRHLLDLEIRNKP